MPIPSLLRTGRPSFAAEAAACAAVAALILVLAACATRMLCRPGPPPMLLLLGLDDSRSQSGAERGREAGAAEQVVESLLPSGSRSAVWAFDLGLRKLYDGRPDGARELWLVLDAWKNAVSPPASRGTRPDRVLKPMLDALRARPAGERAVLALLWDGEDSDPAASRPLLEALAREPGVAAVWVVGADQTLRPEVERRFARFDRRLVVSGMDDITAGLEEVRCRLAAP